MLSPFAPSWVGRLLNFFDQTYFGDIVLRKLASLLRVVGALSSNHAARPDARGASQLLSPSQSRAGGRER